MSVITDFFRGTGRDHAGRTLAEVVAWDDAKLESVHDWVQWLFPNRAPSAFNHHAPLLTDDDVKEFGSDPSLRAAMESAAQRAEEFYRLDDPRPWWVTPGNHNFLRLTRILLCLRELGLASKADRIYRKLLAVEGRSGGIITPRTAGYWREAAG